MLIVKVLLCAVILVCTEFYAVAQNSSGTVAGRVTLEGNAPAAGANVVIGGTQLGAQADENGNFTIEGVPAGLYRIEARLIGYETAVNEQVEVQAGGITRLSFSLHQQAIELNQVEVTGSRRQEASDVRPSVTTMTPRESKILPGAAEDVLRSLQALPGVTSVSDFSSQLVIRGSGPDQNLILIDGFEVLNPYRLYGVISMFNPETVSDISLQTGGFAAQYGDRLSAVLDVKNREGRTDVPFGAKVNTSLTNMNVIAEGRLPFSGGSYLLSFRRTYYDLILGPVLKSMGLIKGDVALPNFRDLQAKVAVPLGNGHRLGFNVITSRDGARLVSGNDRPTPDSVSVLDASYNTLAGFLWQWSPSQAFVMETRLSWYKNDGSGMFDGSFVDPSQSTGTLGRLDTMGIRFFRFGVNYDFVYGKTSFSQHYHFVTGNHTLEAGFGIDHLKTDFTRYFEIDQTLKDFLVARGVVIPTNATIAAGYNRYSAYLQDKIALGSSVFLQPGIRLDRYPVLRDQWYVVPRITLSFKVTDLSTIRAAYGAYFQSPGMEKQDYRQVLLFTPETFAHVAAERADHYILGYDRMITAEWQLKVDTYFKQFSRLIVPQKLQGTQWAAPRLGENLRLPSSWGAPQRVAGDSLTATPVNDATGRAYGFEIMLQKISTAPDSRFTGWISYALSSAERDRDGIKTPFLFDQRHAMNIVGNYRLGERWDVGARFTLRSGRPFVRALGVRPRITAQLNNGVLTPVVQTDRDGKVILDVEYEKDTYSDRLSLYHSLDIRLTTYPRWWGLDWAVYLDVQNVYNQKNEQQASYFVKDDGTLGRRAIYGIPIFPSLGLSVEF